MATKKKAASEEKAVKTYNVSLPITGVAYVQVQATDEENAIDAAFEAVGDIDVTSDLEWECHRRIVSGNVFHGMLNEIDVEEER